MGEVIDVLAARAARDDRVVVQPTSLPMLERDLAALEPGRRDEGTGIRGRRQRQQRSIGLDGPALVITELKSIT